MYYKDTVLFVAANIYNQSKHQVKNTLWYSQTVEYYIDIKRRDRPKYKELPNMLLKGNEHIAE